ncbi:SGNH/GDSL hydrolase family protein [Actinoplanes xinjiangensis]|uniref:Lysophospholipase L1-like esterase n=1 Tax=Actinoplanes xinjiangensis TaxID=512350 RepID=A0A316FH72_9ACTN|nr:SGNH/GDSL hydrolase family protein [Actinoplanes xinjiangensis]PWK47769.1 lysophospholipase L1-like esterase [Actinoplanes xinjiangensis]GIF39296.1 lipase 1 [Actinoplanes xinjiangensis]
MSYPTAIFHRVVAVCATVALTATAWAAPATAVAVSVAPSPLQYVALGDSYAAGFGAAPTSDACGRSAAAYPALLAREAHGGIAVRNAACVGATTADVIRQSSALSPRTGLVTITAGANDLPLKQLLESCMNRFSAVACQDGTLTINRRLVTALPRDLNRMLRTVTTAAPNARVIVTGYPLPFAKSRQCPAVPVTARMRVRANQVVSRLNAAIAAAANRNRVRYVDVQPGFAAHGLCSRKPWLVGAEGMRDDRVLHPTATGQARGYLPAVAGSGLTDRA